MKQLTRRLISFLLILAMLFATLPVVFSVTGPLKANTAVRHTLCTSLSAQAEAYYSGSFSYQNLSHLHGAADTTTSYAATQNNDLYFALSALMSSTHTNQKVSYSGNGSTALATYWQKTDAAQDSGSYLYFYTDISANDSSVKGVTMNREHVWPKSRASFYQTGGGSDLHHLRPSISGINAAKSNNAFANLVGTNTKYSAYKVNGQDVIWTGTKSGIGGTLEVRDNIKGDVARILLYVYVRWQQPNLYSKVDASHLPALDADDVNNGGNNGYQVIESLDTLLEWMEKDPVDNWEMCRNDQIENVQGNRNVFIDYPELAWMMFSRAVPSGMSTPSGSAECKPDTNTCDGGRGCPSRAYYDLNPDKWYHEGVDYALTNSLMNGVGNGKFNPDGSLTRAMLVTILYRSKDNPDVSGENNPFKDVPNGKWYTDAIIWAAKEGIVTGTSETTFAPNASITREQIATILYRYEGLPDVSGNLSRFADAFDVSSYAEDAMTWAVNEGIINGSAGKLSPRDNATRAQIATILFRYLSK